MPIGLGIPACRQAGIHPEISGFIEEVKKMRRLRSKRAQSTLEYVLILSGLIAAVVLAKGYIQTKMNDALNSAGDKIVTETDSLMTKVGY